jgi:hypothetical protein
MSCRRKIVVFPKQQLSNVLLQLEGSKRGKSKKRRRSLQARVLRLRGMLKQKCVTIQGIFSNDNVPYIKYYPRQQQSDTENYISSLTPRGISQPFIIHNNIDVNI